MKIYFVRHGESEANVLNEFSNRGLKHGLTEKGKSQASKLSDKLRNHKIDLIYSSSLLRAQQTAEILSENLAVPVKIVDELIEHDCGLEGKSDDCSWDRYTELMDNWLRHKKYSYIIEGGESYSDLRNRFVPFVNMLLHSNSNGLLVGHGSLYRLMLPEVIENIDNGFTYNHHLDNCDVVVAEGINSKLYCTDWCGQII